LDLPVNGQKQGGRVGGNRRNVNESVHGVMDLIARRPQVITNNTDLRERSTIDERCPVRGFLMAPKILSEMVLKEFFNRIGTSEIFVLG